MQDLQLRFERIAAAVSARWRDVVASFGEGFLAGLLSNIVTTIVNALVTTGARAVRMIREGTLSLLRALRMMLCPPEGLTPCQAAHEGMKLLAAGGIIVGGIALEEAVNAMFLAAGPLAVLAPVLTAAVVGAAAALGMAVTAHLIDKVDLLGVVRDQRTRDGIERLDVSIEERLASCDRLLDLLEELEVGVKQVPVGTAPLV